MKNPCINAEKGSKIVDLIVSLKVLNTSFKLLDKSILYFNSLKDELNFVFKLLLVLKEIQ